MLTYRQHFCFRKVPKETIMYLPLSLKEQAMVVAVKENLQLEDLPKTRFIVTILTLFLRTINYQTIRFPAKELNALVKIIGSYVITQSNVSFNKVGGGVPTSDEINEVKSIDWYKAVMCRMGPGRKITISKMVNDGDLQWSVEYDREGCNCSSHHSFTLSSYNKIFPSPAVSAPGRCTERAGSIGAGKLVHEACLLDENRANKLKKQVIEWEVLDNDNLKMRWVHTYLISDIQISFSSQAERI